jgi:hypothetical protein
MTGQTIGRVLINRFGRRSLAMSAIPRFADTTQTSPEIRERATRRRRMGRAGQVGAVGCEAHGVLAKEGHNQNRL